MPIKFSIIFLYLGLFALVVHGQKSNIKKADEVFDAYAYIDAREIYLKVVKNGYQSAQVYKNLGDTYYFNGEYADAAQWYKKLIDNYPNELEPEYYYRAAQTYKSIGDYYQSKRMMGMFSSLSSTTNLANNFIKSYPGLDSLVDTVSEKFEVINITHNLSGSDFGPSFYQNKLVYASSSKKPTGNKTDEWTGLKYLDLYEAELDEEYNLSNPISISGDINTPYHESTPVFTKDGKTVYFTRNNYLDGKKKKNKNREITLKIYKAIKNKDGAWTNVTELPINNDGYATAHPTLSPDEKRLYFSSDRKGGFGKSDLWYVEILDGGGYGTPKNLGPEINTEARETFPYISGKNTLYFASDGHLGLGGLDIFAISLEENGPYKKITNLKKPINSSSDDFGFIMDEEKKIGFLSSNREGANGSASDNIYKVRESCKVQTLRGMVTDAMTQLPVSGTLVTLLNNDNEEIAQTSSNMDGIYQFEDMVDCNKQYSVRAEHQEMEYSPTEKPVTILGDKAEEQLDIQLSPTGCPPNDLGCRLDLQPIYFDYGKYEIRPDAEVELAKILEAMKEYPQLKIHIESHTDSRSSDLYNIYLSQRRALATMQWLIDKGIASHRLSAKGYGETQLLNECANGVQCPEAKHELNRRSVFIIKE
ncbi:OmpA family protein [Muricauda sp. CAU 1633]|uniref:OmpA family protein n=1 Tax=Allomuricauda sp. CAU 1633 TaxID=2816036 RepID=UPI001A8E5AA9|nr:OmpA family protein [Muricauda sp. CAU 1633]MBO0323356.1 OmpA family protein [Muricauda sp. CAU 1633]